MGIIAPSWTKRGTCRATRSLVIAAVLRSAWLTAAFVVLMYTVASVTAGRRMTRDASGLWAALPGRRWDSAGPRDDPGHGAGARPAHRRGTGRGHPDRRRDDRDRARRPPGAG